MNSKAIPYVVQRKKPVTPAMLPHKIASGTVSGEPYGRASGGDTNVSPWFGASGAFITGGRDLRGNRDLFDPADYYFNAGLVLIDIEKWWAADILGRMEDAYANGIMQRIYYDQDLLNLTRHFFEADKPVCSVCHGIEIIAAADCIRGKTVTTVAKCALDATTVGAEFVDQACVIDGNLVCGRTWHDNTPMMKAYMELLNAQNPDR